MKRWVLVLGLILAGCSTASKATTATTGTSEESSTSAAASTTLTTGRRAPAGKVTAVHDQHVTIDSSPAGDGDTVPTGATVASDSTGSFDLSVGSTIHKCLTDHDSALQVLPSPSVLIAWQHGASWCQKSGGTQSRFGIGPGLIALMQDPVFAVRVGASGTVLKVQQGFVKVQGATGSVLVGPGQQMTAPPGGAPGPVVPLEADEQDNTNFGQLAGLTPAPAFARPSAQGSAALARILRTGVLQVRFATPAPGGNPQAAPFSRDFFDFLTRHWDLKLDSSSASAGTATSTSAAATTSSAAATGSTAPGSAAGGGAGGDVRVEAQTGANAGTPLLSDGSTVWRMVAVDTGLQSALRGFLVAALGSGDYADLFTHDFGRPPTYDAVSGLVAPG